MQNNNEYHFIPIKMTIKQIKTKTEIRGAGKDVEKLEPSYMAVKNVNVKWGSLCGKQLGSSSRS